MTVKDGFDVDGMPAAAGNPAFTTRPKACADAAVVASVRRAGAVVWGKTNVPLMLSDFQSYNAVYGTTNNPYDFSRTPGGSSGGAAAALASGITPLEIGSDIGGSLRHPANFCGVLSLKPTWGTLSLRGHVPPPPGRYYESDLGVAGPMARNAADLRLLYGVLHGKAQAPRKDVKGARIAIWDNEPSFPLAREVREAVGRAADALAGQGAVVDHARPGFDGETLMAPYRHILTAILGADFPDTIYDGMQKTHAADRAALARGDASAAFRAYATSTYREFVQALTAREILKDQLANFFEDWDAIVMPISPVPPFRHLHEPGFGERTLDVDGTIWPYDTMLNWIALATALHAPAIAVPAGRTGGGLPRGVQLVAPWHCEDRLFDYAAALEDALGGFAPPAL